MDKLLLHTQALYKSQQTRKQNQLLRTLKEQKTNTSDVSNLYLIATSFNTTLKTKFRQHVNTL